jgi:predicted MPP superfamily phosphohydrolase
MSRSLISRRQFLAASGLGLAGVAGSATYAFAAEPRHVELSPHDVPIGDLAPELEGLRILQISDVHLHDGVHPAAQRTIHLAEAARPDITLFTGDMCERTSQLGNLEAMLRACRGRLATLAIMGNWEYAAGISAGRLGHTHGGQIRLPPIPAVTPPGSGRFVAGWYRDTFAPMYVSRGIGTTEIRARFLCPPEAPLFTLRRA